jgi:DNA-binding NarL/FixJ family response regulator
LPEEAMTRLLRARTGGDLNHPILLRLHRISEGNPLFALEIARALTGQGARPAPGEPLPVPEDLGAPLWVRRARDDLARVGGAVPPSSSELTPTEQRIAQLVGEGKKNREVAEALFISVKTVEANLSRIFHKLGVRSRTELSRRIAATHRVSPDSSPPHET